MGFDADNPAYLNFTPRPDDPARYDQQKSFVEDHLEGVAFIVGGNGAGCASAHQPIYDPVSGITKPIGEIKESFHVWALDSDNNVVIADASQPKVYGVADLYQVTLSTGVSFQVTLGHRLLTPSGWREIGDILRDVRRSHSQLSLDGHEDQGDSIESTPLSRDNQAVERFERATGDLRRATSVVVGPAKVFCQTIEPLEVVSSAQFDRDREHLSSSRECASRSSHTPSGLKGCCCRDHHQCDGQPLNPSGSGQSWPQQSGDAPEHNLSQWPSDGQAGGRECSRPCRCDDPPSMIHSESRERQSSVSECASSSPCSRSSGRGGTLCRSSRPSTAASQENTDGLQSPEETYRIDTTQTSLRVATVSLLDGVRPFFHWRSESSSPIEEGQYAQKPCVAETQNQTGRSSIVATPEKTAERQSHPSSSQTNTTQSSHEQATDGTCGAFVSPKGEEDCAYITSIQFIRRDEYWDFSVAEHENYWMEGIWHHNTTSAAMCKLSRFLMSTLAPRQDTPFWIIGDTYDLICDVAWKEKLYGNHFLPHDEIDYERIKWKNNNLNHPFSVPLRSWEGDPLRNWLIEFKSYKQGRKTFQGSSIGGFCFVEQFPWSLLQETLMRCRDYHLPGSQMAEFTPVDPMLSTKLQEMQENGLAGPGSDPKRLYMPKGWGVYRANTMCAMEAGNVDKIWFRDVFGAMDAEEREVRMVGAWPTYEGQIYKTFNPSTKSPHNIELDEVYSRDGNFPLNAQHRRSLDWGFSSEHAFVALWGYWQPDTGSWVIYDEYYSKDQSLTVMDHLGAIQERHDWPADGHHGATYADPSNKGCIRIASRMQDYEYTDPVTGGKKRGLPFYLQNAANRVHEGIEHVKLCLNVLHSTGLPKLRICKETCPNLWRELQTYRWLRGAEMGLNPHAPRQDPLKKDDDTVDALRYLLFSEARQLGSSIRQILHQSSYGHPSVQLAGSGEWGTPGREGSR